MPDIPAEQVRRAKEDATERLIAVPGVVAVGIGPKIVDGEATGEPAIRVFVRDKRPPDQVADDELIPSEIDGVATDVAVGGEPIPLAGTPPVDTPGATGVLDTRSQPNAEARARTPPDTTTHRPLVGGAQISVVGSDFVGTLGCLLWDPADHDVAFGLTHMHVIAPAAGSTVTKDVTRVGQPRGIDVSGTCCNDVIGVYAGGGRSKGRDEALVRLSPGQKWKAAIEDIGPVAGVHPLTQGDVTATKYKVAKRGRTTKVTGGWVACLHATTIGPGNVVTDNRIIIEPNPVTEDSNTDTVFFAIEGDSGSALVNGAGEVVGLVSSRNATGQGFAYEIGHVLARLAADGLTLEVATSTSPDETHTVPGASSLALPPEMAQRLATDPQEARLFLGDDGRAPLARPWFADLPPAAPTVAATLADLSAGRRGQELLDLWHRHHEELTALLERDRRVALAWHRGGGAALNQLLLRLPLHPEHPLPDTLHGEPLTAIVDRVHTTLAASGSPSLGAGLGPARELLPDLGGRTYAEIVAALGAEELVPGG